MESYYSRFYKLMNELTRNNLQVTLMQVNVQFLQQLQPEWSRFVTIVKQSEKIDTVSYHKLFDILKQFQLEVNDIRAERIAKSANPLALIAAAQPYSDNYYQAPKPQRSNATSSSTRPSASTRQKGKEIAKPITPQSESVSVSDEDSDPEQLRGTRIAKRIYRHSGMQQTWDHCYNSKIRALIQGNSRSKAVKDYAISSEKMRLCKQAESSYMAKIQRSHLKIPFSTGQPLETEDDSNVTPDSTNKCNNDNRFDQNAGRNVEELAALAYLIAKFNSGYRGKQNNFKEIKKATHPLDSRIVKVKTNLDENQ
ncbi:hypothetical protein Tco_1301774 [Tanacetum coccineum]